MKMHFAMTDCGEVHHFLGIRIQRSRTKRVITFDQEHYIDQILEKFGMSQCKPVGTPLDKSIQLKRDDSDNKVCSTNYRQIIGSIMYAMLATRPDIAAAVSIVSQFLERPSEAHLCAAKRILRYLKGTKDYKLHLGQNSDLTLVGYSDANWGNDPDTRRSTTGYLFYLSGGVITWSSKRQPTVALSSMEAEYMAHAQVTIEAIWLRNLLSELGFKQKVTTIYEDNQSCIALAKNPIDHQRVKHIDTRYHFIRERIESGEINLEYLPSEDMIADALTKALPKPAFTKLVNKIGLFA